MWKSRAPTTGMKRQPGDREAEDRRLAPNGERNFVEGCMRALLELLPGQPGEREGLAPQAPGVDGRLTLRLDGHKLDYAVETKRKMRKDHVGPLIHRARELEARGELLLLCADRVPDELGALLREHEVAYLDLGGNAYLHAQGLYVLITGRPAVAVERDRRNLTGTEARLLGVFLRDLDAGEVVQKELAQRAGIAFGAVGPGREKLVRLHILEQTGKRRWRMADRVEGLRRFADGWVAVVRHKLRPRRYRMLRPEGAGELEERMARLDPTLGCLLGGERAAGHLTRYLRTDHATLHVVPGEMRATAEALLLVPDEEGPVMLLDRYGCGDAYRAPDLPAVLLVNPLLVWAECQTVPDERVALAARHLYEERLLEIGRE